MHITQPFVFVLVVALFFEQAGKTSTDSAPKVLLKLESLGNPGRRLLVFNPQRAGAIAAWLEQLRATKVGERKLARSLAGQWELCLPRDPLEKNEKAGRKFLHAKYIAGLGPLSENNKGTARLAFLYLGSGNLSNRGFLTRACVEGDADERETVGNVEAGATFREYAARICAEVVLARETILPAGELRGRLRIAAPVSFGATHVAPLLAELAKQHPLLHLQTSSSDHFVDVVNEVFDAAIRIGHLADSNLIARRIGPIFGKLVASPSYIRAHGEPQTPEDIVNHEALCQHAETWRFVDDGRVVTVNPRGRFNANNGRALVAAAVAGLGITSLPDFLTDQDVASGLLVPIMRQFPVPEAGIYVIRPRARIRRARCRYSSRC